MNLPIPAGTIIYSMSVKEKREEYHLLAEKYNIYFIFDDHIPTVDFYAIPQIDIIATDGTGGFLGTLGEVSGLDSPAHKEPPSLSYRKLFSTTPGSKV